MIGPRDSRSLLTLDLQDLQYFNDCHYYPLYHCIEQYNYSRATKLMLAHGQQIAEHDIQTFKNQYDWFHNLNRTKYVLGCSQSKQ